MAVTYYGTCQAQFSTQVTTKKCDYLFAMPNAFTPNADGENDTFRPAQMNGYQFLDFSIYNRWGQKVYETKDLNKGWDGRKNGIEQGSGVYVWMIVALKDGKQNVFKGTVVLLK